MRAAVESGWRLWQYCRMEEDKQVVPEPAPSKPEAAPPVIDKKQPERPREIGGRDGPDPTRYGDWEKAGRCIDF